MPLPPKNKTLAILNRQKKQIRLSPQNLKSKKLRGKQTQQLQKSLGALKIVNNSGSQFDWGKLKTKVQFKISQSNCLIAVNSSNYADIRLPTLPLDTNEKQSKNQNHNHFLQSYTCLHLKGKLNSRLCIMGNTLTRRSNKHCDQCAYPILHL